MSFNNGSRRGVWLAATLLLAACGSSGGGTTTPEEDAQVTDLGPADTGPADTGPSDTGPADTGAQDTGPADTGPEDAGQDVPDVPPPCTTPNLMCGERCVDPATDTMNCGMCGNACPMGQSCVMGACACLMGRTACAGICVDTQTDDRNCGTCGTACPSGQSCQAGACVCPTGQTLCGGSCVSTQSDTANCGMCGNACPASQSCTNGACACAAGRVACGTGTATVCADPQTDNNNCGMCGRACTGGQTCVAGACACPMGQTFCDGACVNTQTAQTDCGMCGRACGTAQTCTAGTCTCPTGQTACGTSCVNTATDSANCGACGTACPMGQSCVMGACACPMGQTACTAGGVTTCADLLSSTGNCGSCGRACPMGQSCVAGLCGTVPSNDRRDGATTISLAAPATTLTVDTTGATHDAAGPCQCTSTGRDVFYTFTLTQEEIVYADTLDGETWDSALFLQNAMGVNLPSTAGDFNACSDDACGSLRSQLVARLAPGQYYLVLSGCSQGRATIRFQHLPVGSGTVTRVNPTVTGSQTVTGTVAPGTGLVNGGCSSAGPENMFFFATCTSFTATRLHLTTCGATNYDSVLHQQSPARTPVAVCNDDFCGLQSSLESTVPAGPGLHAWYVDTFGTRAPGNYTLRYRFGDCTADFASCGPAPGVCRYTAADDSNCGSCGTACTGGTSCASGTCTCPTGQTLCGSGSSAACRDLQADTNHCGACGRVCPAGAVCAAGTCTFTTTTRDVTVSGTQTINSALASANAAAGSSTVALSNVAGTFEVGDLVVLHQTQRASGAVGFYEYRRVTAASGTSLTVTPALTNGYVTSDTPFARAQVVRVEEVRNLTVPAGATLNAPAWNGNHGGLLAVTVGGTLTNNGTITMTGRGFRGRGHACVYRCARGFQGEGVAGLGGTNILANANGGGGGGAGQDDASGGGGGHGAAGTNGGNGTCGACREACPIPGGTAGTSIGAADLSGTVFFGGAGGEGGADEDGGNPGAGGSGGGAILVRANVIANAGNIDALGTGGAAGSNTACGGVGCGMGGGGGGAGGAVRLQAITSATLGTNLVRVSGGGGGGATCGTAVGGAGSAGRIGVNAPTVSGGTTPSFDRN